MTTTSNASPRIRRRTVLSMAGTGALGALAGCMSAFSSDETHAFHTHGHRFTVVEEEGSPIPEAARYEEDVVPIAPAERLTLEFDADSDPGIYPVHCHKVDHVTTDGRYPGGMATAIVYEEAMGSDEFAEVMDDAGFEG